MFVNSKDILFISLSAGFLVLVVFICLALVQLTRVLKNTGDITDDVSQTTHAIKEGVDSMKEKLASYSAFMASLGPVIKKAMDSFKQRTETRKSKGKQ